MQHLTELQRAQGYTLHRTCVGGNKGIQKDLDDGIDTIGKKMTVCQLYAKQIRHRGNVRYNTKNGRKRLMKLLEEDKLGGCPIDSVKLSDAKEWAIRMKEKGISYKTISNDKCRNEPESITVHYGTFQHYYDAELLRTRYF